MDREDGGPLERGGLPPPIRTHPVRWIVLEVVLLLVLGLAAEDLQRPPEFVSLTYRQEDMTT
jgi:hypothetical protein